MNKPNELGHIIIETATTIEPHSVKINKDKNNKNRVIAEGVLQDVDVLNRNRRWYSGSELFPQITSPRTQELITTGNMRAENGHPLEKDLIRQQTIDPNNTVAIFLSMWTENNFVKGRYRGTNNIKGDEFDQDLRDGFLPSWSLRALGKIENTNRGAEVKGLKLITYDRVIYPSHKSAYTTNIVSESGMIDGITESGNKLYIDDNDSGMIIPITNDSVISYLKSESANLRLACESLEFMYNDISIIEGGTQVQLTDNDGTVLVINLEQYIHDEIMNNCCNSIYSLR